MSEFSNSILRFDLYPPKGFVVLPGYMAIRLFASFKNKSLYEFFKPSPRPKSIINNRIPRDTVNPDRTALNLFFLID